MKIRTKLLLTLLLVSLVPLAIISILSYYNAKESLTDEALSHLESVATIQSNRVESIIDQNIERIALITSRTSLLSGLMSYITNPNADDQNTMSMILNYIMLSISDFKELSIITLDGKVVASTDAAVIGTYQYSESEAFIRGQSDTVDDVLFRAENDELRLYLSGPMYFEDELLGVLLIESDGQDIISVARDYSGLGNTGETTLAKKDTNGDALYITPLRYDEGALLSRVVPKDELDSPMTQALLKNEGLFTDTVDYRGEPVLAATKYIEKAEWGLVTKMDKAEALAPIAQLQYALITVILLSLALVLLISLLLSRAITRPVVKLAHIATRVSEGDLNARAGVTSRDEIGVLERAWNQMTDSLVKTNSELEQELVERKKVEDTLRDSEERYRDLFDNTNDLIQSILPDGHLLYVNKAWREVLGYTEEDIANLKVWDIIHPDSINHCMQVFQRVMSGENVSNIEAIFVAKDGNPVAVEGNAHCRFVNGKPASTQGIFRDVTSRKMAEERIKHLNSVLRALRNVNQLITREPDREHLVQQSCDILVRDRGYEKAWILLVDEWGNPLSVAVAGLGDEYSLFLEQMKARKYPYCVKELWSQENRLLIYDCPGQRHKNCILADVHKDRGIYRCRLEYGGKVYGVLGTTLPSAVVADEEEQNLFLELADDISYALTAIERQEERKRTVEALRESEEKYRSLVGNIRLGIFRTTPGKEGRFVTVNEAMTEITGYSREELLEMNVCELYLNPEEREQVLDEIALAEGGLTNELNFRKKNGSIIAVRDTKAPIRDANGNILYFDGILEDITERKKMEKVLQESEEHFRALVENAFDCTMVIDKDETIQYVTPSLVQVLGYKPEEWVGKKTFSFLHPDDVTTIVEASKYGISIPGHTTYFEVRFRHKDGSWCNVETVGRNLLANPAVQGIVINFRDITERRKAEQALADEATRRRILIEQSRDGIVILNQDGGVYEANQRFADMLGYSVAEVHQLRVWDWDFQFSQEQLISMIRSIDEKGDHFETKHRRKDGSVYDVEISTNGAIFAGQKLIFCVCRDITERKKMEEALKSSEEKLRLMFESVADSITVVNLDGNIVQTNEATVHMHGYENKEEIIGRPGFELIAASDRPRAIKDMKRLYEVGFIENIEYTFLTKDGREFPGEIKGAPFRDASGNLVGIVVIAKDITERKKMEEQLIVTDRLASVGELASGIAHELNNPLTGVIGLSQLIIERDVPEDIREDLKMVNSEAQRAVGVVKNLLTFARKHPLARQLININDVINKVLELRAYEQKVNNIQVVDRMAPDLPQTMADYFQLQQVFLNIIINAEYFMIEAHGRGTLTITTEKAVDIIRASFNDDGPGIPQENLGHIFDPFFTTKEVGKGTGLGLSICHGIVISHGGRLYAESEPGKGATFIVELPIKQEEQ